MATAKADHRSPASYGDNTSKPTWMTASSLKSARLVKAGVQQKAPWKTLLPSSSLALEICECLLSYFFSIILINRNWLPFTYSNRFGKKPSDRQTNYALSCRAVFTGKIDKVSLEGKYLKFVSHMISFTTMKFSHWATWKQPDGWMSAAVCEENLLTQVTQMVRLTNKTWNQPADA